MIRTGNHDSNLFDSILILNGWDLFHRIAKVNIKNNNKNKWTRYIIRFILTFTIAAREPDAALTCVVHWILLTHRAIAAIQTRLICTCLHVYITRIYGIIYKSKYKLTLQGHGMKWTLSMHGTIRYRGCTAVQAVVMVTNV